MSSTDLSWDHVRSLLCVLREGSLSAAARTLGLTQPTLARHIEQLEAALGGAKLFTRSPAGLAPTDIARSLVRNAETMESAAAALVRTASASEDQAAGVVRITASQVIGAEVLPAILRDLRAEHPGLKFELDLSNQTADLLRREADIAVRMVRPKQAALVHRKVGDVMLGLFARTDYLAAHGTPRRIEELYEHAIIGVDRETTSVRTLRAMGFDLTREMFTYRADNDLAQLAAIRAGCGIGLCQVGLARRAPGLVRLFPKHFAFALETWITMHEDLRGDKRMRIVFDSLAEALGAYAAIK